MTEPRGPRTATRLPGWFPLVVVAAAWLAQGGVLAAGWVGDDGALVRDHPAVRDGWRGARSAFAPRAWPSEAALPPWRPLAVASFALEAPLWRQADGSLDPFGFHLTNLFLHGAAAVLLLAVLLRALAPGAWPWAAGAALLFAVHPIATPAVASLAGRADLLALLLALATARVWLAAREGSAAWLPLLLVGFLLALASHESAVGLPVALLVLEAGLRRAAIRGRRVVGLALLGGALAVYLVLSPAARPSPAAALAGGLEGSGRSLVGFFVPVGLLRDPLEAAGRAPGAGLLLGGALALLGLVAAVVRAAGGRVPPAVAALAAFAGWSLAAALLAPEGEPLAARAALVTGPGLFTLGGGLLAALGAGGRLRLPGAAAAVVLLALLGLLARHEARAWLSDEVWQQALLQRHPDDRGIALRHARRLREQAELERDLASALPTSDERHAALVAGIRARLAEAGGLLLAWTQRAPEDHEVWRETGLWRLATGDAATAEQDLKRALHLDPLLRRLSSPAQVPAERRRALALTWIALGTALEMQAKAEEGATWLSRVGELGLADFELLRRSGILLARARRWGEALASLRRAIDLAPTPAAASTLSKTLEDVRRAARDAADAAIREAREAEERAAYREALFGYETALAADPARLEAWLRVAWIRGEYFGDYQRAAAVLDEAERIVVAAAGTSDRTADALRQITAQREALEEQRARDERAEGDG